MSNPRPPCVSASAAAAPISQPPPGPPRPRPAAASQARLAESIVLAVTNNFVTIESMPAQAAKILDRELRYPTLSAHMGSQSPESGWDGWVRLLRQRKDGRWYFPTGLLQRAEAVLGHMRYVVERQEERRRPALGQPVAERPIGLFDYQRRAVEAAVHHGRGVIDSPPRSGKTRCMTEVVRRIALPCLWVAPTRQIVKQSVDTLRQFLGDGEEMVCQLVGGGKLAAACRAHVVVCTAQTAAKLGPELFATRQMLVVDEWHHAASQSYRKIFQRSAHIYFRFGMTGTHFRSGEDGMAMEALLGEAIFKISSEELVQQNRLVPLDCLFVPTHFDTLRGVDSGDFLGSFGKYGAFEHVGRNQLIAHVAALLARYRRKTLILVRTKAQGRMLAALVEALVPHGPGSSPYQRVEFVSTDRPRRHIEGAIDAFVQSDAVQVLIGTSLIGEGTDLPSADALIYAAAGKAEVTLMQNAYRVCTAYDGKPRRALLVDFTDRHQHKLLAQAQARLQVYFEEAIFAPRVLQRPSEVEAYLRAQAAG